MLTKNCINPKPLSTRSSLDTPITCSFHCMHSSRIYFIVQKVPHPPPPPFAPPQPLQDETSWLSPLSSRSSTDELDKRAWLGLLPARMVRSRPYLLHNQGLAANPGVRDRSRPLPTGSDLRACLFYSIRGFWGTENLIFLYLSLKIICQSF